MLHECRTAAEVRERARARVVAHRKMFSAPRLEPDIGKVVRKPLVYVAPPEPPPAPAPIPPPRPDIPSPEEFIVNGFAYHGGPVIKQIIGLVSKYYDIPVIDIISERRTANVVRARQVAVYLAKTMTTRSYPHIGQQFGGRDHTTALHSFRRIARLRTQETKLDEELTELTAMLAGAS